MALDIAGVRLNMTPDQAEMAVRAKGFVIDSRVTGPSFVQNVQIAINVRDPRRPAPSYSAQTTKHTLSLKGPSGEFLQVFFNPTAEGPRVSEVGIHIDTHRTSQDIFERQAMSKYGKPTHYQLQWNAFYWCNFVGRKCGENGILEPGPYLTYTSFPDPALTLTYKVGMKLRTEAAVSAEVERLAPKGAAVF